MKILKLGSTYLKVKDMEKSIQFYEKLLEMDVTSQNFNRWAQFDFHGNCIALYNPRYDFKMFKEGKALENNYGSKYISFKKKEDIVYGNNFVLNFYIEDLAKEHARLKGLKIGEISDIMYLNVASPYYFFVLKDPDGNMIEITGNYSKEE